MATSPVKPLGGAGRPTRPRTVVDVDLNLLVVLDAILTERSVTRAAHRLHRTQSATSHALSRLRVLFGDPLVVKVGVAMVPTERALQIQAELAGALAGINDLLASGVHFDPVSTRLNFRIAVPDFLPSVGVELASTLLREAPRSTVDIVAAHPGVIDEAVASALDLVVTFGGVTRRSLISHTLGQVPWCAFMRADHPLRTCADPLAALSTADRVTVRAALGSPRDPEALPTGIRLGRVKVTVPSYADVAAVLAATDLVAVGPKPALIGAAPSLAALDFEPTVPPVQLSAYWSGLRGSRPHHPWLRQRLWEVVERRLSP